MSKGILAEHDFKILKGKENRAEGLLIFSDQEFRLDSEDHSVLYDITGRGKFGGKDGIIDTAPNRSTLLPAIPGFRRSKDHFVPTTLPEVSSSSGGLLFAVDIPNAWIPNWVTSSKCPKVCQPCCVAAGGLGPFGATYNSFSPKNSTPTSSRIMLHQTPQSIQVTIETYAMGSNGVGDRYITDKQKEALRKGEVRPTIAELVNTRTFNADRIIRCSLNQDTRSVGKGQLYAPCPTCCETKCTPIVRCCRYSPCGRSVGSRVPLGRRICFGSCTAFVDLQIWDCVGLRKLFPPFLECMPCKACHLWKLCGCCHKCCYSKKDAPPMHSTSHALLIDYDGGLVETIDWTTSSKGSDCKDFDLKYSIDPELAKICQDGSSVGRTLANVLMYCSKGNTLLHSKGRKENFSGFQ